MADINLKTILKVRRGTTENWNSTSYILKEGELGFDSDLKVLKIGDGTSNWETLEPVNKAELSKLFDAAGEAQKVDAKVTALTTRVDTNEGNISTLQGSVRTLDTDVSGLKTNVSNLQETVKGLTGAMHFVGTSTSDPTTDGPTIEEHVDGYKEGDVCLYGNKEYIYDGENWKEFGDNGDLVTNSELALYLKKEDAETTYAKSADLTSEAKTARAAEQKAQQAADAAKTIADAAMPKAGGTFTGTVTLAGDPTTDNEAATKKYVDDIKTDLQGQISGLPAATITDVKASSENDGGVTVSKDSTVYTVAHKKYDTTGPSSEDEVQTSYITGMTVVNGHITKVTSTSLEAGLNKLTNTFVLDGGNADGNWGE